MPKDLVFNERSLSPPFLDPTEAAARMKQFLTLLSTVKTHSRSTGISLRTSIPLHAWLLAPDYSISQWRNDKSVDIELRRKLLAVGFNWPAITEQAEPDLMSRHLGSECLHEGQRADGLGLAWLLDGLAISFDQQPWVLSTIPLTETTIGPADTIEHQPVQVRHASRDQHADEHASWLRPSLVVSDGLDLWNRRSVLFPRLSFCSRVERQLEDLDRGHPLLDQVLARLQRLDAYVSSWTTGPFDIRALGIKITPESDPTLSAYETEHTFVCPDGQERRFSLHARMTPDAWRLFFYPVRPGEIVVGHIGKKLPTVSA